MEIIQRNRFFLRKCNNPIHWINLFGKKAQQSKWNPEYKSIFIEWFKPLEIDSLLK